MIDGSHPFFTVIIPVFNRSLELERSLYSALQQTFTNFECIVVDDGSSKNFRIEIARIIQDSKDSRVRLIRLNDNRNGAFARNIGAKAAKGKYLSFLDSDDEWSDTKLFTVADFIKVNPNCGFVYHQYVNVTYSEQSSPFPARGIRDREPFCNYSFVSNKFGGIQSSCITVSRDLFC